MHHSHRRWAALWLWSNVLAGYGLLACALTWPLPRHLQTHLTGDVGGDLGTYVWNVWIFRHELLQHAHLPLSTTHLFAYSGGTDFTLHNYAPIASVIALPLVDPLGVVGAFNAVMLASIVSSGIGLFILARRLGLGEGAAWSSGAIFMAAPALIAREAAHFSLLITAALPLFLWANAIDSDAWSAFVWFAGWCFAIGGIALGYYAAAKYVPAARAALREGRASRVTGTTEAEVQG